MLQPFGTRYGRIMWTYLMTYSAFVANAVLGIFALIVLSMERRFQENNDLLMRIGHRTREDNTLVDELDKRVHAYYVLLQALRSVSELFQTYVFVQVVLLVPRFIDASWHVQEAAHGHVDAIGAALTTVQAIAVVTGQVVVPANLHATVQKVHASAWCNERLWLPYNKKVITTGRDLLDGVHHGVGISLGAFTVITRSLVVTPKNNISKQS
ncbi:hypothetical protein AAVH_13769 [Aphelenchoides avenae]|nr:hypothetical protein AAVH_13769 [Aphelenchus avenae]